MQLRSYRPEIDGLRAIAVIAVVGYHYGLINSLFHKGFIGVDVFFVISGYLITQILLVEFGSENWLRDFYLRRIRRIFPTLFFVLVTCLLVGFVLLLPFELRQLGSQVSAGALFSSNFQFWLQTGYFDADSIRKPLLHLWSLGVEEQFYIFYPLVILLSIKFKFRIRYTLITVISMSWVILTFSKADPAWVFYSPFTRAWELAFGGIVSTLNFKLRKRSQDLLQASGAFLLASGFFLTHIGEIYPNISTLLPVGGTVLILVFVRDKGPVSKILSSRVLVFVGKLSYSLYLWHWPLLSFFVITMGYPPGRIDKYLMFCTALVLSFFTYRIVETRFSRLELKKSKILPIFAAVILLAALSFVLSKGNGIPSRIESRNGEVVSQKDISKQFNTVNFANPNCLRDYPNPTASNYQWWFCKSNSSLPPQVLLWGNSYANQYFQGLSNSPLMHNVSLLSIGDCPIQREKELIPPNPCAGLLFDEQRDFLTKLIMGTKSIQVVVVAGLMMNPSQNSLDELRDALEFLQRSGKKAIVFYPHIKPSQPIFGCVGRPLRGATWNCKVTQEEYSVFLGGFQSTLEMIREHFPETKVFNPNTAYCYEKGCSFIISGLPTIRDGSGHMSDWGSKLVADHFSGWLRDNKIQLN